MAKSQYLIAVSTEETASLNQRNCRSQRQRLFGNLPFVGLFLLLLLTGSATEAWGQIESGFYYLENKQDNNQYYLVPAAGTGSIRYYKDNEATPYLTTYQTKKDDNSIWYLQQITQGGNAYYRFIHCLTGKYIVMNGVEDSNNPARRRLHLESTEEPDETAQFLIVPKSDNTKIGIRHETLSATHIDGKVYWWWDVSDNNQNSYSRNDYKGLVGLWVEINGDGYKWAMPAKVEKDICLPPVITYDAETKKVTISTLAEDNGVEFYYTTDGTEPTTSSSKYTEGPIELPAGATIVSAIAKKGNFTNPVVTTYNTARLAKPAITLGTDGKYTITSDTEGATIYYTIDGTPATMASTKYEDPIELPLDTDIEQIRAIATTTADGSDASLPATHTVPQCEAPTITNTEGTITMTTTKEDGTICYTTDGKEPLSTNTQYTGAVTYPLNQAAHTIKARAFKPGYRRSAMTSLEYKKLETPKITKVNSNGSVTLTPGGATFRCTTSNTVSLPGDPGFGSTDLFSNTTPLLPEGTDIQVVKVRAYKLGNGYSDVLTYYVPICDAPIFQQSAGTVTITCPNSSATIYYSTSYDGEFNKYESPFEKTTEVVRGYAGCVGYQNSEIVSLQDAKEVSSTEDIDQMGGSYKLSANFTVVTPIGTAEAPFTGTIDGQLQTVTSTISKPIVAYANNATIKNVILGSVNITDSSIDGSGDVKDNVGAIVCNTSGSCRIYNCGILSGSVGGSKKVGGLVGLLDDRSRVINCFSYADITGGTDKGGIVGYNNKTSTNTNLTTMVMNCMFYGDIAAGGNVSPIYGGTEINNVSGGLPNYNYYRYDAPYSKNGNVNKYNRALAMEEKFITRFERYRLLLNSNRPMAAFYATGDVSDADSKMAKWVLETADRTIEQPMPYPVLKKQGQYPSIINYDAEHAPDSASVGRNHGGRLSKTLTVTISGVGDNAPDGASLNITELTLQRTDKDFDRFNYNYDKVQLPYYNDVGTGNYTGNKVVTGWKITGFTGGTAGSYKAADEWGGYNFADRNCTDKDKYSVSGRVFSQGAYFDVPNGVTAITIEPYWGQAAYVCDQYYDVNYTKDYGPGGVTVAGKQHDNNTDIDIYGDGNKQKVYTTIDNARKSMSIPTSGKTVYDYAVVLVGNVHQYGNLSGGNTPYTLMSIDLNHDNEPDCSFIFSHNDRQAISPIRFDFINIPGISEAQMPNGATTFRNPSLFKPKGWFEITNTCVINFSQFEYDNGGKTLAPLILQGGTFEQFVSTKDSDTDHYTSYIHVGSNAWFSKFGNGTHSDGTKFTPHIPVSVTGGDFDEFYLSGTYQPNISNMKADDAECYVSGGHFGEMAAGSLEGIQGDVRWDINWADITNFYGGGTNANNPITGNIQVDIANSHVNLYCGGPKFGDMSANKSVTTNATGCTFVSFFGAGFGGNSYNRVKYYDKQNESPANYQSQYTNDRGKYFDGKTTDAPQDAKYGKKGKGVATDFDYEFFVWSTGGVGGRFYVKFVSFSLATAQNVTSNLNRCKITGDFYGGASYGKVDGDVTSTLTNCQVDGSVYGAGYSATLPTIAVRKTPAFTKNPSINKTIGMFEMGEINETEEYQWKQVDKSKLVNGQSGMESTSEGNFVWTAEDLTSLGTVSGNVTLNILGDETEILGDVYGGGALANSNTDYYKETNPDTSVKTTVNLLGGQVNGNAYGGGMGRLAAPGVEAVAALVGNVVVELNKDVENTERGCVVTDSIFGCNNINGSPQGDVKVHIYKTQNAAATQIANPTEGDQTAKVKGRYDVQAVFGGGNLAAYIPAGDTNKASVVIDGCDLSSIEWVYGGGNAAPVPEANVTVNGCFEIGNLFGGGNGAGEGNPGADVGLKPLTTGGTAYEHDASKERYGTGNATTTIRGGTIGSLYGGSNTLGDIVGQAQVTIDEAGDCPITIDRQAFAYGNEAPMTGQASMTIGCVSQRIENIYGGAKKADVGDINLTITSGTYGNVFGGNDSGGDVNGTITVTINETGCHPIRIGNIYGGGNQAAYTAPDGRKDYPQLNIVSATSIGNIFGGGYGVAAKVNGNPHVNINMKKGQYAGADGVKDEVADDGVGYIGTVYGGGNQADVEGDTYVEIGTGVSETTGGVTTVRKSAHITGNVYGGGNEADVTGSTHVTIGQQQE